MNVRGLNSDPKKRRDVFNWLKNQKHDIYLLQETHCTEAVMKYWESEWGYKCVFSNGTSTSRGVAVLFNNTFEHIIKKIVKDKEGRFIGIDIEFMDCKITLVNIYGPNTDDPAFFEYVTKEIEMIGNDTIIWGGDFNTVQNHQLDTSGGSGGYHKKANSIICDIMEEKDLLDIWREKNPDVKRFTWRGKCRNVLKQSRIDYFLISSDLADLNLSTDIKAGYRTDHSLIIINIEFRVNSKGPGLWKFNNSFLKDKEFVDGIKQVIENTLDFYRKEYSDKEYIISFKLLWEVIKMEIRGTSIKHASLKKREKTAMEENLVKEIESLEALLSQSNDQDIYCKLSSKQNDLKCIREEKIEGIITRAKARWYLEGEKNSKYFCNLEKRHFKDKCITNLVSSEGNTLTETKSILDEEKKYLSSYTLLCRMSSIFLCAIFF